MELANLLTPYTTRASARVSSKKTCLELIAEIASEAVGISEPELFKALFERERLGSTGLGGGIAIPHCRIADCQEIMGVLLTTSSAISFDAHDDRPVDIVFALIAPIEATSDHLQALATIAGRFNDEDFVGSLRMANDSAELFSLIS